MVIVFTKVSLNNHKDDNYEIHIFFYFAKNNDLINRFSLERTLLDAVE